MPVRMRTAAGAVTWLRRGGPEMPRLLEKLPPGRALEVGSPRPRAGGVRRGRAGVPPSGTCDGGRARRQRGAAERGRPPARPQCPGTVLWETRGARGLGNQQSGLCCAAWQSQCPGD